MRRVTQARSAGTATPSAAQLPLRAQALAPFAVSLALVVALAAVGAALIARQAVDRGLRAQAGSARQLVGYQLDQIGRRVMAETDELRTEASGPSGRRLGDTLT